MKKRSAAILLLILLTLSALLIIDSHAVSAAVTDALKMCAFRIIPSLFAVSVLSTALSKSGAVSVLLKDFSINPTVLTAFILGNTGGYPIGCKLLKEGLDDGIITKEQTESASTFCFGPGPAFAAGVIGAGVFGDIRYGLLALLAVILSNLTVFIFNIAKGNCRKSREMTVNAEFSSKLMTDSVNSSAYAMLGICAMIVFFSALKAVLYSIFPKLSDIKLLSPILEITSVSALSVKDGINIPVAAMLMGFGGICVLMQTVSITDGAFSLKKFFISRLYAVPLAGFYGFIISVISSKLGMSAEAATKIRLSQSPSLIPIICVFIMVLITVLYRGKTN